MLQVLTASYGSTPPSILAASPETTLANLTEVIHGAANTMNRALKAIEHIQAKGGLRAVG